MGVPLSLLLLVSPAKTEDSEEGSPCNQEDVEEDEERSSDSHCGVAVTDDVGNIGQ